MQKSADTSAPSAEWDLTSWQRKAAAQQPAYPDSGALQTALAQEPRFSGVRVEYSERKIEAVWVEGTVSTESDFQGLRKDIEGSYRSSV